jgi:hypothetical protein
VKGPSIFGRQIIRDHFVANIPGLEATIPEVKAHQRPETTCSSADAACSYHSNDYKISLSFPCTPDLHMGISYLKIMNHFRFYKGKIINRSAGSTPQQIFSLKGLQ